MEALDKIKLWLESNAPQIKEALQSPAPIELIEKIESISKQALPEDFKSLYLTHDGLSPDQHANFFYGMTFIPLERVLVLLEAISKRDQDFDLQHADKGIKKDYRLSTTRIPIADDFGSSLICVDLSPSEDGIIGQVIFVDYKMDTGLILASSVSELLSKFSSDLEGGKYQLLEEAKEDGVDWLEPERSIDVVNWYNSPTWSYAK